MNSEERGLFHPDFERALSFATQLHSTQTRRKTNIPYISHLIAVAGLVLEYGGDRDEAIAALLHDSIEDKGKDYPGGVEALRARIADEFGPTVLAIVEGCTDADRSLGLTSLQRKERYLVHLKTARPSVRLVSCADKLHNARTIVADLRIVGLATLDRFNVGRDGTLRYYDKLAEEFQRAGPEQLAAELARTVNVMKELAGEPNDDDAF